MDKDHRLGAELADGVSACRLTAERRDGDDGITSDACVDNDGASEGMPHKNDSALAETFQIGEPDQHIEKAVFQISGMTVIQLERCCSTLPKLAAKARVESTRWAAKSAAGAKHPKNGVLALGRVIATGKSARGRHELKALRCLALRQVDDILQGDGRVPEHLRHDTACRSQPASGKQVT